MELNFDRVVGIIALVLAIFGLVAGFGVALGMDARTRGEYIFSICCFSFSAVILLAATIVWAFLTSAPALPRTIIAALAIAVIGVSLIEVLRWTSGRHLAAERAEHLSYGESPPKKTVETQPPPPPDVHSAVVHKPQQVKLIFKDSPLLTKKRKEFISREINEYYDYLENLGYNIPKEFPAIGTSPNGAWMGVDPAESPYNTNFYLLEAKLDDRRGVISAYSDFMFMQLLRFDNPANRFGTESAWVFSHYYVDSFLGKHNFDSKSTIRTWTNGLWDVRSKYGKEFTDKALFYTRQTWGNPVAKDSFDSYMFTRLRIGLNVIENTPGEYAVPILEILREDGLSSDVDRPFTPQ